LATRIDDLLERWPPWAWTLWGALLVAIGLWAGIRLARRLERSRAERARRLGRAGDWELLATEVAREGVLCVDGEPRRFVARADAVVRRAGVVRVAELKGGPESGRAEARETRRQLLEYAYVFGADGILLVDGARGVVSEVTFPGPPAGADHQPAAWPSLRDSLAPR
jgi:hypothetical protein